MMLYRLRTPPLSQSFSGCISRTRKKEDRQCWKLYYTQNICISSSAASTVVVMNRLIPFIILSPAPYSYESIGGALPLSQSRSFYCSSPRLVIAAQVINSFNQDY
ncbi:hypothetical protein RSAG8_10830, partial [Rhizoctonia solani AG-8 WAC10335]